MTESLPHTPEGRRIDAVIFDFGGVIVDWNMDYLFAEFYPNPIEREHFRSTVITSDINRQCDLGVPLRTITNELSASFPDHTPAIEAWRDRWIDTIGGLINGTQALIADLIDAGYTLYGLSNFSNETFPMCTEKHNVFEVFCDIVLSGEEHVAKPDHELYNILFERNGLDPSRCVFLDDSQININAAHQLGLPAFLFTTAEQARTDLASIGVSLDA